MQSGIERRLRLRQAVLLRHQMIDELVFASKAVSEISADAAGGRAEEAGWVLVGSGDVAGEVTFAIKVLVAVRTGALVAWSLRTGNVSGTKLTVGQFGGVKCCRAWKRRQECSALKVTEDIFAVARTVGFEVLGQP